MVKYRFDRTLSLRLYPAPCAACDPCTACIPAIALYDIKVARNKQTIEEYADRVVELQKMFGIDDVVNWPQPAPHNDRWETVCSRGCGTVLFMHKSMGWRFCWYSRFDEPVGTHCPDCGWWLGLDGEGSPVVAPPGWKPLRYLRSKLIALLARHFPSSYCPSLFSAILKS